jgi:hypothetical protein
MVTYFADRYFYYVNKKNVNLFTVQQIKKIGINRFWWSGKHINGNILRLPLLLLCKQKNVNLSLFEIVFQSQTLN